MTDRPISDPQHDVLDLASIAQAIGRFVRNVATVPPLTIAITGEWGAGKSSLLNLLETELSALGHIPVAFNAWHNESEQDVLSALFASIIEQSSPRGLGWIPYRARLLFRRWTGRSAGTVLALGAVLAGALFVMGYAGAHPAESSEWLTILGAVGKVDLLEQASKLSGGLAGIALLVRLGKDLRSYGVDVGKLAASVAGSASVRDRRAQLGFRSQFARDFADVVWAHGQRRLVLLVDDLDRCQPGNAVRLLEAINFLTSAGDCFVVLAMSRRVVEQYVAMEFANVASALAPALPRNGGDDGLSPERRYARAYLEKLVNIEVCVPTPSADAERRLYQPPSPGGEPTRGAELLGALKIAWTVVLVLAVGWGIWRMGALLHPDAAAVAAWVKALAPTASPPVASGAPRAPAPPGANGTLHPNVPQPGGAPSGAGDRTAGETGVAVSTRTPLDDPALLPANAHLVSERGRPLRIPAVLIALALTVAALLLAGQRPAVTTRDSPAFQDALVLWHPVIRRAHPTPRSLKRFLNRVRFDAMRMRRRQAPPASGRAERLIRALVRAVGLGEREAVAELEVAAGEAVPEPVLVALAALAEYSPELLADGEISGLWAGTSHAGDVALAGESPPRTLAELVSAHVSRFGTPFDPVTALTQFARLREGISIR